MFALVDCNSFYASCERVFRPDLAGRPVIVLSNNDGCVIARSMEAKKIGVRMGAPFYQIRRFCEQNDICCFSSNYALYGDLSSRVMRVLQNFSPLVEQYSIDEAFLQVSGIASALTGGWPQDLIETVGRWTGIPVSVGIAATKTLAKIANHHAKGNGSGYCRLLNDAKIDQLLSTLPPEEVWGVAGRTTRRLNTLSIWTALDLKNADPSLIRDRFGIVLERTVRELRGEACLSLEEDTEFRQSIQISRSFGNLVAECADLEQAVAAYATRAGEKLRRQNCVAGGIYVYLQTNPHRKETPYSAGIAGGFERPTDSTFALAGEASRLLKEIYRPDHLYQKAGVMLLEMTRRNDGQEQGNLFAQNTEASGKKRELMKVIDGLNQRHGKGTVRLGSQGFDDRNWKLRSEYRSPRYTTNWQELPKAD